MRSSLLVGISSAVTAVAMAGSANAGVLMFDDFQAAQDTGYTNSSSLSQSSGNSSWVSPNPAFNGSRYLSAVGYQQIPAYGIPPRRARVNIGGGEANLEAGMNTGHYARIIYGPNTPADLTNYVFTVNVKALTGSGAILTMQLDNGGEVSRNLTATGTYSFAVSEFGGSSFNPASVSAIVLTFKMGNPGVINASATLSDFNYTVVPAPGAVALLGAAGLVGGRRRKA